MKKTDLPDLTLVGPTREDPVLDPLVVLDLDDRLYIISLLYFETHCHLCPSLFALV